MAETILVVGHKNPDNDSIASAICYAYLKNQVAAKTGEDVVYKPVRLGPIPVESQMVIDTYGLEEPELISSVTPDQKLILVDHNETKQIVDGGMEAQIIEVVDHHRLGDFVTSGPIRITMFPYGATASILTREFEIEGIEIPQNIAACLLGAILTDTVITKSPTCTDFDRMQIAKLSEIAGLDYMEYGLSLFKCRGGESTLPIERLVGADSKEFSRTEEKTMLIGQFETVNLEAVLEREAEIREYLKKLVADKGYEFALFFATDIIAEGSQFMAEGDTSAIEAAFGVDAKAASVWMPGILSRKKQVAAPLLSL